MTRQKPSQERLIFAGPTIWYSGMEGNFLFSQASPPHIAWLTTEELKHIEKLPSLKDSSVLERFIRKEWLKLDTEHEARIRKVLPAILKLQGQYSAAWKSKPSSYEYHRSSMNEALRQFDSVETTCSHVFRKPGPVFRGRTYGQALAQKLRKWLKPGDRVLEVGGGTGILTDQVLEALKDLSLDYSLLDLSPRLQASQREYCKRHKNIHFLDGDILSYDFGSTCYDFVLANEVLADLPVEVAELPRVRAGKATNIAEETILKYELNLDNALPKFCINVGAVNFLERLPGLLKPGGRALFTEYGSQSQMPSAVDLGGHREHSIHFGHLATVANKNDMAAELSTLGDFLEADSEIEVLELKFARLLSSVLGPFFGIDTPLLLYSHEQLKALWGERLESMGNLRFSPIRQQALSPFRFKALICVNSLA